jgi:hypothetical protein
MVGIIEVLSKINLTLTNGLKGSYWDLIIPIGTTLFSVIIGALLGTWLTNRSENKKIIIDNHKIFLEDFHEYFVKVHSLYQEIYSYDQLISHLEFPTYFYDFNQVHQTNMKNVLNAENEYQKFIVANTRGSFPVKEQYWEKIHQTCIKLQDFNLIIDLASSMNQNAQVSSLFVSKPVKQAFDSLILQTQHMSQNNFADFNLQQYRLKIISILQLIKNEIDPDKTPLFFEHQDVDLLVGDSIKIATFSNLFKIVKIKNTNIYCTNAKGKNYTFDKHDLEKF